jgi:hypothetical protein
MRRQRGWTSSRSSLAGRVSRAQRASFDRDPIGARLSEQLLMEFIRLIPTWLWMVLAATVIGACYRPIREELLARESGTEVPLTRASLVRESV